MRLRQEVLIMLADDIQKIEQALNGNSDLTELHMEIDAKYQNFFSNWGSGMHGYIEGHGFKYEWIDPKHNLTLMLNKLRALQANRYSFTDATATTTISPTFNNTVDVRVDVSFVEAKEEIGNMGALTEKEIQEIFAKIDELETVIKSNDRKPAKWEKAKEIAKWVLDKSADVAIAFLPLLMQIK